MKKREYMIGVLVIRVPLCSHPIDILENQTVIREFQFLTFYKEIEIPNF